MSKRAPARNKFLLEVEYLFGNGLFEQFDDAPAFINEGLALLHKQCNRRFWGIPGDEMDH